MVHHARIEHIRQIDRVAAAGIRFLTAVRVYDMALKERTEFPIEKLRIGSFVVIEDTEKDLTCLHCVYGLVCFFPATAAG